VAVHDVDVDHAGSGCQYLVDLRTEPAEIRREDRGRDVVGADLIVHSCLSMLPWQWLHCTIAVVDIRTMVECSPQLGHTETSSKRLMQ
jgi:hypothetical protein